jgi:TRAP-type C4-dicarboxylate transport system permease small subunit
MDEKSTARLARAGMGSTAPGVVKRDELQYGVVGQALKRVSRWSAIAGGMVFVGLVVMSIVSIVGRKLASSPVPGDVELLQMCSAFAASAFFAHCHLNQGDVKVDFFTHRLPSSIVAALDTFGSLLVGLFGTLIAWRTAVGALSLKEVGETTAILGLPVWIGQSLMVPGFALLSAAGYYMAWFHWRGRGVRERAK